jgi:quercetin dioxygenase-like cupin family protein
MHKNKLNLEKLFSTVTDYFSPKIIGEVNDVYVKIAKVKGQDVPWHTHDSEDELFYVVRGALTMKLKGRDSIILNQGEFFIVEKGVEHRVYSKEECWLMLIENKTTKHTGDVRAAITKSVDEQHY